MPHPDVLIIGAGIIGVTCAEALARAGARVVLLDRRRALQGCTAAGGGMLTLQTKAPGAAMRLARRSMTLIREAAQRYETEIGLRWCGSMILARTPAEVAHLQARATDLRAAGVEVELLDASEARAAEPELAPAVLAGSRCDTDGQVDPALFGPAALDAALRCGAQLREETDVTEIAVARGRVLGVRTSDGIIESGAVVVAAGAWSTNLLTPIDPAWEARIVPRRGVLLRSDRQPPLARPLLLEASYYPQKSAGRGEARAFSLQQLWDGRLLLGGTRSFAGFGDALPTDAERGRILARAAGFLPALAAVPFPAASAGLRPWTPDGLPLVGPTTIDGLYLAAGHEGDGVTMAAVTAEIIAALITGGDQPFDAAALDPARLTERPAW